MTEQAIPAVNFGIGQALEKGFKPSVTIDRQYIIVAYTNPNQKDSTYQLGEIEQTTVVWKEKQTLSGVNPSIATNTKGEILATCIEEGDAIFIKRLKIVGSRLELIKDEPFGMTAQAPKIDFNAKGQVAVLMEEVNGDTIAFAFGQLNENTISWSNIGEMGKGNSPDITINDNGQMIATFYQKREEDGVPECFLKVGSWNDEKLMWETQKRVTANIVDPSVTVANNSTFAFAAQNTNILNSYPVGGNIKENNILNDRSMPTGWGETTNDCSVGIGMDGKIAALVYESNGMIKYSITNTVDRRGFMNEMLSEIKDIPLRDMVFPGANNAGSYYTGNTFSAITQDFQIVNQWWTGTRYFDFRLNKQLEFVSEAGTSTVTVKQGFEEIGEMCEYYREFILVKVTLDPATSQEMYKQFLTEAKTHLAKWLVTKEKVPAGRERLADITMGEYLAQESAVLLVIDGDFAQKYPENGFWVYRNTDAPNAAEGDLIIYDAPTNTTNFTAMKSDQLAKLANYQGVCPNAPHVPCDLYLMSWVLEGGTIGRALEANPYLCDALLEMKNAAGYYPNILNLNCTQQGRAVFASQNVLRTHFKKTKLDTAAV